MVRGATSGTTTLRIQSTLAEPVFEAAYDDKRERRGGGCRGSAGVVSMTSLGLNFAGAGYPAS
jgi:hypothetical protein